jgi:hypothetical protein
MHFPTYEVLHVKHFPTLEVYFVGFLYKNDASDVFKSSYNC